MKYRIYHGQYPNGKYEIVAISVDVTEPPEDFFLAGAEIKKMGEIEIEGDTHLLAESFSVK